MNPSQRATFAGLAAVLIPGDGVMPGAAEVDLAGRLLDRALAAAPGLAAPLTALLDEIAGEPPELAVPRLEREQPSRLELLMLVAFAGYLLDPVVRSLMGYPGQEALALPRGGEVAGEAWLEGVLARRRRWRGDGTGEADLWTSP